MQKPATIAVSTMISLLALASPVVTAQTKKSVALIPGMMPMGAPPRPVHATAAGKPLSAQQAAAIKKLSASSYPQGHMQRGLYLRQQGDNDRALVEFLRAAQENPMQVQAFYEQALIFKKKGYNKLAQSALQQALAIKPDYRDARVLLASLYLECGDLSHATGELVRSLGLQPSPKEAPAPTIVQMPHGRLPVPEASKPAAAKPAVDDAFKHNSAGAAPTNNTETPQKPTGIKVRDLTEDKGGDDELLKKILGITPTAPESHVTEVPVVPGQRLGASGNSANAPTVSGLNDNPLPKGVDGRKVITASDADAQRLLKQLHAGGADQEKKSGGAFSWFNPFNWFDKSQTPETPKQNLGGNADALMKQARKAAMKNEEVRRGHKTRVAKWMDDLLDGRHASGPPMNNAAPPAAIMPPSGTDSDDFNPLKTVAARPTQPIATPKGASPMQRLISMLPLPHFNHTPAPAPLPSPVVPREERVPIPRPTATFDRAVLQSTLPPCPPLSSQPASASVPTPTATPISTAAPETSNGPMKMVLSMLPKEFAVTFVHLMQPQPVAVPSSTGQTNPPPLQQIGAGLSKGVYENLVSARVSSSGLPEAVNPQESIDVPPPAPTPPIQGGNVQQAKYDTNAPIPGVPVKANEPSIEARLAKAGVYVPPPPPRPQPLRANRLAKQGFHFVAPRLLSPDQYVVNTVHVPVVEKVDEKQERKLLLPEDEWVKRMQHLLQYGTAGMPPGEAFMFSEETGEGVIFLRNGSAIRRKIAAPMDHDDVVRLRRPDIYNAQGELQYNLSLLGKIIKPAPKNGGTSAPTKTTTGTAAQPSLPLVPTRPQAQLDDSDNFIHWLKNAFGM